MESNIRSMPTAYIAGGEGDGLHLRQTLAAIWDGGYAAFARPLMPPVGPESLLRDLAMMTACSLLVLLPNWMKSGQAGAELNFALAAGISVVLWSPERRVLEPLSVRTEYKVLHEQPDGQPRLVAFGS